MLLVVTELCNSAFYSDMLRCKKQSPGSLLCFNSSHTVYTFDATFSVYIVSGLATFSDSFTCNI